MVGKEGHFLRFQAIQTHLQRTLSIKLFHDSDSHHIETSPLICSEINGLVFI